MNRPSKYPNKVQIIEQVLAGMRDGSSAFAACKAAGVPQSTFGRWVDEDAALAEEYARAREDLVERIAEETMAIADEPVGNTDSGATDSGAVAKQRLQVDTRKWLLSKLAPRKYGDRLELAGDPKNPIAVARIERVIVNAKPDTDAPDA